MARGGHEGLGGRGTTGAGSAARGGARSGGSGGSARGGSAKSGSSSGGYLSRAMKEARSAEAASARASRGGRDVTPRQKATIAKNLDRIFRNDPETAAQIRLGTKFSKDMTAFLRKIQKDNARPGSLAKARSARTEAQRTNADGRRLNSAEGLKSTKGKVTGKANARATKQRDQMLKRGAKAKYVWFDQTVKNKSGGTRPFSQPYSQAGRALTPAQRAAAQRLQGQALKKGNAGRSPRKGK